MNIDEKIKNIKLLIQSNENALKKKVDSAHKDTYDKIISEYENKKLELEKEKEEAIADRKRNKEREHSAEKLLRSIRRRGIYDKQRSRSGFCPNDYELRRGSKDYLEDLKKEIEKFEKTCLQDWFRNFLDNMIYYCFYRNYCKKSVDKIYSLYTGIRSSCLYPIKIENAFDKKFKALKEERDKKLKEAYDSSFSEISKAKDEYIETLKKTIFDFQP